MCNRAYGENLAPFFAVYVADFHVLAYLGRRLVGHAMVVARWLQPGKAGRLRTAYVEIVATEPEFQGRGIGAAVMQRTAMTAAGMGYDVAALCPADTNLYRYLGWEYWRGPLFIRAPEEPGTEPGTLIATPEERVMILRLPNTPPLDLTEPLSAEWRAGGELW